MTIGQLALPELFLKRLENRYIDWDNNCIFENGIVLGFKNESASNNFKMIPIPQDSNTKEAAQEALTVLQNALKPSNSTEIVLILKNLSVHCAKQNKSATEIELMLNGYISDLQKYPSFLIHDACNRYRRLPDGNEFMPTIGRLIAMIEPMFLRLKLLQKRAEQILGLHRSKSKNSGKLRTLNDILNDLL